MYFVWLEFKTLLRIEEWQNVLLFILNLGFTSSQNALIAIIMFIMFRQPVSFAILTATSHAVRREVSLQRSAWKILL